MQNAVVVTASTTLLERNINRIKVRRIGVDEVVMHQSLATAPTISADRSSFELIVRPAARADSTLMRSRIRLFSVVNWIMMVSTVPLALGLGSSDRLAGAYGTAVSTTMLLTTVLLYTAAREIWHFETIDGKPVLAVTQLGQTNYRDERGRKQKSPNMITTSMYFACK